MARPSDGRPAQPRQASRKRKSAWRKNIDLSSTEAALEDIREQERTVGAAAHTRKDDELFVVDRAGQETAIARQARPKRKLRSQEILEARSAVPAVQSRARSSFQLDTKTPAGKAHASGMSAKMKKRLRILASRPHTGIEGADEVRSAGRIQSDAALVEKHDLWGAPQEKSNEWIEPAAKPVVKEPRSKKLAPFEEAEKVPAVPLPHPGMSYNPDADAHDELLNAALAEAAAAEQDEADKRALKQQWFGVTKQGDAGDYMGMIVGDADDQDQDGENDQETDDADISEAAVQPRRKSKAQRLREARAKEQQLAAARRKQERMDRAAVAALAAERRKLTRMAAERIAAKNAIRAAKMERLREQGMAGERLGKHRIPVQRKDVQTGDELSESLRQLKPEGNLFWDRFQSLQARGRAEPRRPLAPTRRKYKLRTYDSHYFKRD
ncbi:hypothetical protein MCUN1_002603 [Malassezia cuniculi]|uniref:Ribosome biogenesis protein NOP53 n=1 Tax=Malassezia cuniculi TaxID=948313 RepID=A0AAF0J6N4_9BASI|nr:hypothetical protein MCUN1_002603 [Malassezia cuniculi]